MRFELKPIGKTLDNILSKGLIAKDEKRAGSYQKTKKIIDEYHKAFIEKSLAELQLDSSTLSKYVELVKTPREHRTDAFKKSLEKIQLLLRKQIVATFKSKANVKQFNRMFKKELLLEDLPAFVMDKQELVLDPEFNNFTSYFVGFHENRKNMYAVEDHKTAIAYRIVHENLPKFLDNCFLFEQIAKHKPELLKSLQEVEVNLSDVFAQQFNTGPQLDKVFKIEFFNQLCAQSGIDSFNSLIGGRAVAEGQVKTKGLNEIINLYNQQQTDKKQKIGKFKLLYKQMLSDRSTISFLPEQFNSDQECLNAINHFYRDNLCGSNGLITRLNLLLSKIHNGEFDLDKIYIKNSAAISQVSHTVFQDYSLIGRALSHYYTAIIKSNYTELYAKAKSETAREKLEAALSSFIKSTHSITEINDALQLYAKTLDADDAQALLIQKNSVKDYFEPSKNFGFINDEGKFFNWASLIESRYSTIHALLNLDYPSDKQLIAEKEDVAKLKIFLDSVQSLLNAVRVLELEAENSLEKDEVFYTEFIVLYEELKLLMPLYNKVRNYCTKKPYSTEKIKLNFDNPSFLEGWDQNKEQSYRSVLLRKNNQIFLGVIDKENSSILTKLPEVAENNLCIQKMQLKFFPGAAKAIPKSSTQLNEVKAHFENNTSLAIELKNDKFVHPLLISRTIYELNNTTYNSTTQSFETKPDKDDEEQGESGQPKKFQKKYLELTKDEVGFKNALNSWIDFCKEFLRAYAGTQEFNFVLKPTDQYESLVEFYKDVDSQGYSVRFINLDAQTIDELVEQGKIYLFQIYNKDFSEFSKGKPSLHTIYFKSLFEKENLENLVYRLSGGAEMFFRKASIQPKKITHPKGIAIANKNPLNTKTGSIFEYDLQKDKRFTLDKFHFHLPIEINFKAIENHNVNAKSQAYIAAQHEMNVIGIDRGERHLIYITVVNPKGQIIHQESLNTIGDEKTGIQVSYHNLLDAKETSRESARKEWGTIESIKELKEGYLSQVVHQLASLMLKHHAVVVMEDLNFGFKRGRFHVEKQVYQNLERMLIQKLNYLVLKDKTSLEVAGKYNALQLTAPFESFAKLGKQTGFLFYVPAWNTSKIDPTTGFVDLLKPKYENLNQAQVFWSKFDSIRFNTLAGHFEFSFDYQKFTEKAEGSQTKWTVCTQGQRYRYMKAVNQSIGAVELINVTESIQKMLIELGFDYSSGADFKEVLMKLEQATAQKKMFSLLACTLAMRYSNAATQEDYILSPVANSKGEFFDTRTADGTLPQDADANGAFHIALKGLWVLQKIQKEWTNENKNLKPKDLAISNKQWLSFAQTRLS